MTQIGFHCSHECHKPSDLLRYIQLAEDVGFAAGMCSDHFHPWNHTQGQSGFAWSWLGAALQATRLTFGMVSAPGQRYHPAIIAQAAATLAEMYPGRLWCAFGSGQYLNEHITGEGWMPKEQRQERLREAVDVIRALWAGETVTHYGYFDVEEATLYTRPAEPPLIFGAALTEKTAEWVGGWADGIITSSKEPDQQKKFIEAFRRGGGEGKPMIVQALHAYAETDEKARQGAWEHWRTNVFGSEIQADLKLPSHFEAVAKLTKPEDMDTCARISADLDDHLRWIESDIELGFDKIFVHNAAGDQERFIEAFGRHVLPRLAAATKSYAAS